MSFYYRALEQDRAPSKEDNQVIQMAPKARLAEPAPSIGEQRVLCLP